jgi:hypothetical protein
MRKPPKKPDPRAIHVAEGRGHNDNQPSGPSRFTNGRFGGKGSIAAHVGCSHNGKKPK